MLFRSGYRKRQPEGRVFSAFLRHYPVNLQTVMLRKAALESMDSLFDPNFDVSEEYDLFIRMLITRQAGYLHEPLVQYRIHQNMASIRRFERYPVENRLILGKLRVLDPALDEKYRNEVRYLEAKIGYWEAAASMRRGDLAGARQDLAPHKSVTLVFLALYCATFLPPAVWNKLHELRFALKSPVSPAE